jgi:hypothetical protein
MCLLNIWTGTALTDPIVDEELIDGTVGDINSRLDTRLLAHNRTDVDATSAPRAGQAHRTTPTTGRQKLAIGYVREVSSLADPFEHPTMNR